MESPIGTRLDPNVAASIFLELANEHSLQGALQKVFAVLGERPDMACLQIWRIENGDRCLRCPLQDRCADHRRCLHFTAGRGVSVVDAAEASAYFGDPHARIPLGYGLLGKAARDRQTIILPNMTAADHEAVGVDWTQPERIRALGIAPIVFKGEILGVLAGFIRQDLGEDAWPWSSILADHIAAVIANARSFEEIQRLKAQLELQNTYLQEEVVEAKAFGDLVGQSGPLRQLVARLR